MQKYSFTSFVKPPPESAEQRPPSSSSRGTTWRDRKAAAAERGQTKKEDQEMGNLVSSVTESFQRFPYGERQRGGKEDEVLTTSTSTRSLAAWESAREDRDTTDETRTESERVLTPKPYRKPLQEIVYTDEEEGDDTVCDMTTLLIQVMSDTNTRVALRGMDAQLYEDVMEELEKFGIDESNAALAYVDEDGHIVFREDDLL